MKNLIAAFLLIGFISCSKESVTAPAASIQHSSSAISFSSANISIFNFKAQTADSKITVGFVTTFQKDVKTLEILRGTSPNNLCSIYKTDGATDSNASLQYSTNDTEPAGTFYYIVKYTLQNNDWGYTPVFTLQTAASTN